MRRNLWQMRDHAQPPEPIEVRAQYRPSPARSAVPMPALLVTVLLLITSMAYWPGVSGDFLFDDFANLPALGRYGGVRDLDTFLYYLLSGIADPTGRPISLLSFLLDARDWPAEPWPFKRTNLLVHLGNGALLYSVLVALGRRISVDRTQVRAAALLATAFWLMHPLWVSTVLYVIQRQAMLAAFFTLCGIRAWIASHEAFEHDQGARGWLLVALAVPLFGTLAGLSKANGFLLPLLLAVLQTTVLRPANPDRPSGRCANLLFAWIPAATILAWLTWHGLGIGLDGHVGRPWSLGQRLLSQPRALWDYLHHLLVPGLDATGVFADGFQVSRGWWAPWTTLPALVALAALAGLAWTARMSAPVLAAGLGLFLAGHAMESSVIMLEPYFEHRNYLPSLLLFWPLAWMLASPNRYRHWLLAGGMGYALVMLLATTAQARLWADPLSLAQVWAEQNPGSARAQTYAALQESASGQLHLAEQRLDTLLAHHPGEPQYAINLLDLRCAQGNATAKDVERAALALRTSRGLALDMSYHWLSTTLSPDSDAACGSLSEASLAQLLQAAIEGADQTADTSVEAPSRVQHLLAHQALRTSDCGRALGAFDRRIDLQPRPEFVQTQVELLATHCGAGASLAHLERYLSAGAPVSRAHSPALRLRDKLMREFWAGHWQELRKTLQLEVYVSDSNPPILLQPNKRDPGTNGCASATLLIPAEARAGYAAELVRSSPPDICWPGGSVSWKIDKQPKERACPMNAELITIRPSDKRDAEIVEVETCSGSSWPRSIGALARSEAT